MVQTIIKELEKMFQGKFNYLGENTENFKAFSVPITQEVNQIFIRYLLDIYQISEVNQNWSDIFDNLAEVIHEINCKYGHDNKKCITCETKYKDRECSLENTNLKEDLILHKCLSCHSNYQKFWRNLTKEIC